MRICFRQLLCRASFVVLRRTKRPQLRLRAEGGNFGTLACSAVLAESVRRIGRVALAQFAEIAVHYMMFRDFHGADAGALVAVNGPWRIDRVAVFRTVCYKPSEVCTSSSAKTGKDSGLASWVSQQRSHPEAWLWVQAEAEAPVGVARRSLIGFHGAMIGTWIGKRHLSLHPLPQSSTF